MKNGSPRHSIGRPDRSNNQKSMKVKLMKRISYLFVALVSAALISCQKENADNGSQKGDAIVFSAYVDGADPESKTVIRDDQNNTVSLWSGKERIWILNGQSGNTSWKKAYKADVSKPVAKADFTEENGEVELTGNEFYAIYPCSAADDAAWNGGEEFVTGLKLKEEQTPFNNTYDPSTHIAVAYTTAGNYSLAFKNAVSYFKLTVGSDNVSEICIFGNASEKITGAFSLKYTPGDSEVAPTVETSKGTLSYVKIISTEANPIVKGNTYYIAVLPTDFTTGFSVEMVSGGLKSTCKTTKEPYTMTRNKIVDLGTIEYVAPTTQTVYLYANNLWNSKNAELAVYYWGDGDGWVDFTDADGDGRFEANIPIGVQKCHYVRCEPGFAHNWDHVWNRYDNVELSKFNCLSVAADEKGSWYYTLSKIK